MNVAEAINTYQAAVPVERPSAIRRWRKYIAATSLTALALAGCSTAQESPVPTTVPRAVTSFSPMPTVSPEATPASAKFDVCKVISDEQAKTLLEKSPMGSLQFAGTSCNEVQPGNGVLSEWMVFSAEGANWYVSLYDDKVMEAQSTVEDDGTSVSIDNLNSYEEFREYLATTETTVNTPSGRYDAAIGAREMRIKLNDQHSLSVRVFMGPQAEAIGMRPPNLFDSPAQVWMASLATPVIEAVVPPAQ